MISRDQLLEPLNWRYATKQFDPARKIPDADWAALEEALILTPSSYGLQPWNFIVVTDLEIREKLVPFSWGQRQPADCSHFVVFAIKKNFGVADINALLDRTVEVRGGDRSKLDAYGDMMIGDLVNGPRSKWIQEWMARQAYIALGNFMTSAALLGIDTCPMEGLDPAKYDEILGLPERGLATVVACPAGYRAAGDKYALLPKVRFSPENLITRI
jgi:nitroreductase